MKNMELLAKKAGAARGTDFVVPTQETDPLPPSDLSLIPEQSVVEWVSQLPGAYETLATDLDTQAEKAAQTNKKLDGLLTVTRKNLRRPKGNGDSSASFSTAPSIATAASAQWGYSLLK